MCRNYIYESVEILYLQLFKSTNVSQWKSPFASIDKSILDIKYYVPLSPTASYTLKNNEF